MVKQGIKNYFVCLKYFFTPLGTMFLGIMLGVSAFLPAFTGAVNELFEGIGKLSQSVNLDFGTLCENLWGSVTSLNWANPAESFQKLFSAEWVNGALTEALTTILGTDFETFKMQIEELVSQFSANFISCVSLFLAFWILGFFAGYSITKLQIRIMLARRTLWKIVLYNFLNSFLSTVLVVLCMIVFVIWKWSIVISLIISLFLVSFAALVEAYLLHGYKKIRFNEVVNFKSAGLHIITNFIIFAISIALTLIAVAFNAVMGLFVGLTLIEIALIVAGLNAESYVKTLAENQK